MAAPDARLSKGTPVRLVSYTYRDKPDFGVLVGERIVPGERLGVDHRSIREVLIAGALDEIARRVADLEPQLELGDVTLEPVVPDPGKIICAGVNYRAHRDEAGRAEADRPTIFTRFADSQLGAGAPVRCPAGVARLDYEGELAAVIGRGGRDIAADRAFEHIAGYACYNDFSARDWQRHSTQWTAGKNLPGTGGFGPFLATADEIDDVTTLKLETRVNGDVRQSAVVADLLFSIPELIAYVSSFTPLSPGDVLVTGTPGGVGLFRDPPEFLETGDVVEVEITSLGVLRNTIERAA